MLTTMPIGKLLWQYALPAMLAMSASAILNICDTIFLGRGVGLFAIAGLAVTFPLMTLISGIGALASVGGTMQTAIHKGKDDSEKALTVFGNVFSVNMLLGIILTVAGLIYQTPMLKAFGASDVTLPYAQDYMQIILLGSTITISLVGMTGQMRAADHPRKAMVAQLLAVLVNLILDPIAIFVLGWGIKGAAIATVVSQAVGWIYLLCAFLTKDHFVYFTKEALMPRMSILKDLFAVGISPFFTNLCGCGIVILINLTLIYQGGDDGDMYIGTYAIIQRITQFLVMGVAGLGQAMQIIASTNLAAQEFARVRRLLMTSIFIATGIMTFGYFFVTIFADPLSALFSTEARIVDLCVPALRIGLCTFPFIGSQMIAVSFFQAIRLPKTSMIISLTRQMVFLAPMLVVLPNLMGVNGVWWSMALADVASVTITWVTLWYQTKKLCV